MICFTPSNVISSTRLITAIIISSAGILSFDLVMGLPVMIWIILFLLLLTTDGIDGWLARRNNNVSVAGAGLDQIADICFNVSLCLVVWMVTPAGIWVFSIIGIKALYEGAKLFYLPLHTPIPGFRRWGKILFVLSSLLLIAALLPLMPIVQIILAGLGVGVTVLSFIISTTWQIQAFRSG